MRALPGRSCCSRGALRLAGSGPLAVRSGTMTDTGDDGGLTCPHCGAYFPDDGTEVTAAWLMEHTGITEEQLARMPGGPELLHGIPARLSLLADRLLEDEDGGDSLLPGHRGLLAAPLSGG